ncbi:PREDICTED: membrane-spanning 4-domains subfamily A member 14 [Bison bison bison]|uniref:Membrane-spanning 4-domains subfamily A member 14 n=1 Tax=Bison bison bison TaxID=43346 RepID=A0A6P3HRS6_BISBB|nr:PREDICTED: membrane-spanning 4-domains subfamily A member 14 [Bison bison bison]
MESSSEVKRSTHVVSVQPNETVLTALPYGPHSSLLEFLKGEPKVLGASQVLLALIIAGIGAIFALNYFNFAQRFPLVFLTGYPFWGAFIFTVTGYLTGTNSHDKCVGQGVTGLNVISSVVAVAGIILTIISYRYQHKYCQGPSLEGICVIGRVLYNGILSVLLIISIAELSIAVTIASFRSNCWANSNEIVFFLPSDVTQESELSVPDENAIIQFELQEESTSADSTTNIKPVFFGGYSFFKLRVTKNQFTFQHAGRRGSNSFNTSSLFMEDERQKYVPQTLSLYGEEVEVKHSPPILEQKSSEIMMNTEPLKDEDLQAAITQSPEEKPPLLQDQASKLQLFPSYSVKSVHDLPPQDLPYQAPRAETSPEQDLLSEASTSHVTESHGITSQDKESQGIPLQNTQSHDMLSDYLPSPDMPAQDLAFQRQALPLQAIPFGATSLLSVQSSNMRPSKQHCQLQQSRGCPCAEQKALDVHVQDQPRPRRRSLDKHIKSWLSPKKQFIDKEVQVSQTILQLPDQQAENLRIQEEKPPRQLYQDMQIQEYHDWQSPDRKVQTWQSLGQQSQEWRTQDWKSKEWEKRERQLEMQHSQNWDFQAWQTQDLQVKESRKQRSLFQETQTLHATIPADLDEQSQDVLQDSQHQNKDQQDLQSAGIQKEVTETDAVQTRDIKSEDTSCGKSQTPSDLQSEDAKSDFNCFSYQSSVQELQSTGSQKQEMETDAVQTRDIKSEDTSCRKSQSPTDLQLEDIKPDSNCSSYQSSVQDTYHAYMSNKNSEQDVKQDTPTCSAVRKGGQSLASTSCGSKERQQSGDLG